MSFLKNVPPSYLWAGGMLLAATVWIATGVFSSAPHDPEQHAPLAGTVGDKTPTTVRVRTFHNEPHAA